MRSGWRLRGICIGGRDRLRREAATPPPLPCRRSSQEAPRDGCIIHRTRRPHTRLPDVLIGCVSVQFRRLEEDHGGRQAPRGSPAVLQLQVEFRLDYYSSSLISRAGLLLRLGRPGRLQQDIVQQHIWSFHSAFHLLLLHIALSLAANVHVRHALRKANCNPAFGRPSYLGLSPLSSTSHEDSSSIVCTRRHVLSDAPRIEIPVVRRLRFQPWRLCANLPDLPTLP